MIASEVTSDDLSFGDTAITTLSGRSLIARKEHAGACVSDGEWYNPWQGSHFFCSAFTTQHHCDSFGSMEGHEARSSLAFDARGASIFGRTGSSPRNAPSVFDLVEDCWRNTHATSGFLTCGEQLRTVGESY